MKSNITIKPWGKEILLECNSKYVIKEIWMNKGLRSSLQKHEEKLESILVLSGKIELEIKEDGSSYFKKYNPGDHYTLVPGTFHRVKVLEDSKLIEVSTPELKDVIRIEDDFGREKGDKKSGNYRKS